MPPRENVSASGRGEAQPNARLAGSDVATNVAQLVDALLPRLADLIAERLGRPSHFTRAALCVEFGLSPRTVRAAEQCGELHVTRRGHARLYERGDVERWLADRSPGRVRAVAGGDLAASVARGLARIGMVRS